jgi:hypothetical protein
VASPVARRGGSGECDGIPLARARACVGGSVAGSCRRRVARIVFVTTAVAVGIGYSLLLPFAFTQRISFANWGFLDARYVRFSIAFALGLAWVVALQVQGARRVASAAVGRPAGRTGPFGALAAVVSVLPEPAVLQPHPADGDRRARPLGDRPVDDDRAVAALLRDQGEPGARGRARAAARELSVVDAQTRPRGVSERRVLPDSALTARGRAGAGRALAATRPIDILAGDTAPREP